MPNKKTEKLEKPEKKVVVKAKTAKRLTGVAVRDSLSKTVSVLISSVRVHRLYGKRFARSNKILAHTEEEVKKGQTVTIEESKRFSKNKAWKVVK